MNIPKLFNYLKILFFAKFSFSIPKNREIIVFDDTSIEQLKLIIKTDNSIVMKATTTLVPTFIDSQKITIKLYKTTHINEKISKLKKNATDIAEEYPNFVNSNACL